MKVKRAHYESNNSLAVTVCLYSRDINFARGLTPQLYKTITEDADIINVLHALIMVARTIEVSNGESIKSKQETAA